MKFLKIHKSREREHIRPISEIFADGSSRTSWWKRNWFEMSNALFLSSELTGNKNPKIMLLGSGITDLWEIADLAKSQGLTPKVDALDKSEEVYELNKKLKNGQSVSHKEAELVLKNPVVGIVRKVDDQIKKLLQGEIFEQHGAITVPENLRTPVNILPPQDIDIFLSNATPESIDLLVANNILNNLLFQGYSQEKYISILRKCAAILTQEGVFEFVHNDEFFHNLENSSPKNLSNALASSGLDILLKVTTYVKTIEKEGRSYIDENAGFITTRNKNFSFPNGENIFLEIINELKQEFPDLQPIVAEGSYNDFVQSLVNQTNLILLKKGKESYGWCNLSGKYLEVFRYLATKEFYPNLMQKFQKAFSER